MITRLNESDYGYTSSVQSVLDELYVENGQIIENYLTDNVDIWLFNTQKLYNQLKNNRRKSYSIVYEAMLDLFQSNVNDNLYPKKVRITSEMVQSWFRKHNADFKAILKPVVDKVEEERQEFTTESMKLEENDNFTIINQLKQISKDISNIRRKLSDSDLDRNSEDARTIRLLLCDIYWELDYLEDDGYFSVR